MLDLGNPLVILAQLVSLMTLIISITESVCDLFKIPKSVWNGWPRRLMSWVISIGFIYLCRWLSPYASWIPAIPDLVNPVWLSCLFEGIILGGMANGFWTQEWAQKLCELLDAIFNKKTA